jgi:3-oxoacyl-[acyl-carrier protein] reductase
MTSIKFQRTAFDLTGRVALVTGAGVGIGRAVALQLAGAGAFIGIHFHSSAAQAEATLAAIRSAGGDGKLLPADLTQEDQADGVVDALVAAAGRLDILVNNSGSPLARSSIEECPTSM